MTWRTWNNMNCTKLQEYHEIAWNYMKLLDFRLEKSRWHMTLHDMTYHMTWHDQNQNQNYMKLLDFRLEKSQWNMTWHDMTWPKLALNDGWRHIRGTYLFLTDLKNDVTQPIWHISSYILCSPIPQNHILEAHQLRIVLFSSKISQIS
jgi:hypothetical protein